MMASALLVALLGILAWLASSPGLAVYSLSFWHYLLYGLAYRFGVVPLTEFKREALLMKSVSLITLALVYLSASLDYLSIVLVATGFLLNILAAFALGSDRTYYGYELTKLPPLRVTRFPFSVISHPMLVGNMLAYGGTLLNSEFREHWWPLACIHVALNLGLLAMERYVKPLRGGASHDDASKRPLRLWLWPLGLGVVGTGLAIGAARLTGSIPAPLAAVLGAALAIYACILHRAYTVPRAAA